MRRLILALCAIGVTLILATPNLPAQAAPKLASYYTLLTRQIVDPSYHPKGTDPHYADLNGDGHMDMVALGEYYPPDKVNGQSQITDYTDQPGRVLLGDGNGNFALASTQLFPVDTLRTFHVVGTVFADFNGDGRTDLFAPDAGWDANPHPGAQNRLFLSRPDGGWEDATSTLPQVNDFTEGSAAGDISGRGLLDIFVGNGFNGNGTKPGPYVLLNTGSGLFRQTTANIPSGPNQLLDVSTQHNFGGQALSDVDGDGLPELIVTASSKNASARLRRTTILWNRAGVFTEADTTQLPPARGLDLRADLDIASIDFNRDGLRDLVLVGSQPLQHGWFVQLLVNTGSRQFVDETAARLSAEDAAQGMDTPVNSVTAPISVQVLDFNQDGFDDFAMPSHPPFPQDRPVVWLNDGTGHFSVLKVGDFVAPGQEGRLGKLELVPTRNGFSFFQVVANDRDSGQAGMGVTGILATKPYLGS